MTVRLITVNEVKEGMVTLEHNGRGRVTKTYPVSGGIGYEYRHIDGKYLGETGSHESITDYPVWIEE